MPTARSAGSRSARCRRSSRASSPSWRSSSTSPPGSPRGGKTVKQLCRSASCPSCFLVGLVAGLILHRARHRHRHRHRPDHGGAVLPRRRTLPHLGAMAGIVAVIGVMLILGGESPRRPRLRLPRAGRRPARPRLPDRCSSSSRWAAAASRASALASAARSSSTSPAPTPTASSPSSAKRPASSARMVVVRPLRLPRLPRLPRRPQRARRLRLLPRRWASSAGSASRP